MGGFEPSRGAVWGSVGGDMTPKDPLEVQRSIFGPREPFLDPFWKNRFFADFDPFLAILTPDWPSEALEVPPASRHGIVIDLRFFSRKTLLYI